MSEEPVNVDLSDADRAALRDKMRDRDLIAKVIVLALKVHEDGRLHTLFEQEGQDVADPEPSITKRVKRLFEDARASK